MLAGYCERPLWTGLPFQGAATTPTKGGIVGGVDRAMQARYCGRHFWTGPPFPGAATTPTKGGIVGGVDGALAICTERGRCGRSNAGRVLREALLDGTAVPGRCHNAHKRRNSGRCGPSYAGQVLRETLLDGAAVPGRCHNAHKRRNSGRCGRSIGDMYGARAVWMERCRPGALKYRSAKNIDGVAKALMYDVWPEVWPAVRYRSVKCRFMRYRLDKYRLEKCRFEKYCP